MTDAQMVYESLGSPDPSAVMEALTTDDLIDIGWAVLEGSDALGLAMEIYNERMDEDEDEEG